MNRYPLEATLLSPVVVKRDRQSQRSEGTPSLSGSILRGALATLYLQTYGLTGEQSRKPFHHLFLDESACRFGPLDPGPHTLPVTAVSCKRRPGFLADRKPEQKPADAPHGMADQLWSRVASRLAGQSLRDASVLPEHCHCGNDLKPQVGFWLDGEGGPRQPSEIGRRLNMHVGIDRATHTAAETILYSLDALDPIGEETRLVGWLDADETAVTALKDLLKNNGEEIRAGHARTRGYGRVRLQVGEPEEERPSGWDRWSDELHGFLDRVRTTLRPPRLPPLRPEEHFFFALSLPAGAVLVDPLLRASLDPADMTSDLPPLPPADPGLCVLSLPGKRLPGGGMLWCVAAVAHHEGTRGWNAAHGLPRQDEWTVGRGAVYVYLFEGNAPERAVLKERLARLEGDGMGARRNEGFGRVIVSDDFHRRFHIQEQQGGKR
jgi:CRISPR-associated Csx10 family RAMP protein